MGVMHFECIMPHTSHGMQRKAFFKSSTMSFSSLPYELQSQILHYAIHFQSQESVLSIPCVNSQWRDMTLPILHSHIRLKNLDQLVSFSSIINEDNSGLLNYNKSGPDPVPANATSIRSETGPSPLPGGPEGLLSCCKQGRKVEIRLPIEAFSFGTWPLIYKALKRCEHHDRTFGYVARWFSGSNSNIIADSRRDSRYPEDQLRDCCRGIRVLKFCFNAHMNDSGLVLLGAVLSQIRPEEFNWESPAIQDQGAYHVAIPPVASLQLCKAIRTWDSLRILTLSHIVFPDDGKEFMDAIINLNKPLQTRNQTFRALTNQTLANGPESELTDRRNDDTNPSLEISVKCARGLHPLAIVLIVLSQPRLTKFHIEDVYRHDIWSSKITFDDVELDFLALWDETDMSGLPEVNKAQWISRIRRIVEVENNYSSAINPSQG